MTGMWTACIDFSARDVSAAFLGSKLRQRHSIFHLTLISSYPVFMFFSSFLFIFLANLFERSPSRPKVSLELHMLPWLLVASYKNLSLAFVPRLKLLLSSWICALDTVPFRSFSIYTASFFSTSLVKIDFEASFRAPLLSVC